MRPTGCQDSLCYEWLRDHLNRDANHELHIIPPELLICNRRALNRDANKPCMLGVAPTTNSDHEPEWELYQGHIIVTMTANRRGPNPTYMSQGQDS